MRFLPPDFMVPEVVQTERFHMRSITIHDAVKDYDAVMSSREHLWDRFGAIRQLTAMRDGLRHAAACPAPSQMECPSFRRLLGLAASGRAGRQAGTPAPRKRRAPRSPRPS